MAKTKTSELRERSSRNTKSKPFHIDSFKGIELKDGVHLTNHDPRIRLRNRKLVLKALLEALLDGDHEAFKEILRGHLETMNKDRLAASSGVARTTLFRMLSPNSNPTLKNVAKVFRILKTE